MSFTLDYISRVHATLTEVGRKINTTLIFEVILSLVVIGGATGAITVGHEADVFGIKLQLPRTIAFTIGIVGVAALQAHIMALTRYEAELREVIIRLYAQHGFSDASLHDRLSNPLEFPNILTTAFKWARREPGLHGRMLAAAGFIAVTSAMIVLPIAAQILGIYVIVAESKSWWSLTILSIVTMFSVGYIVDYIRSGRRGDYLEKGSRKAKAG